MQEQGEGYERKLKILKRVSAARAPKQSTYSMIDIPSKAIAVHERKHLLRVALLAFMVEAKLQYPNTAILWKGCQYNTGSGSCGKKRPNQRRNKALTYSNPVSGLLAILPFIFHRNTERRLRVQASNFETRFRRMSMRAFDVRRGQRPIQEAALSSSWPLRSREN